MKFLRRLLSLVVFFGLLTTSSCKRDVDVYVPDNNNGLILNASPVQASVTGKVVDETEQPVVAAIVKCGSNMTTTDSRGLFRFDHISMDKYAAVVTVEFSGYFKGIRTFSATQGSSNYVKIKLTPKTLIGTVNAVSGGAVTLPNSSIVTLLANSVAVKSTGLAYTGVINVYAANIDPSLPDISQTIPGSFQALDANNFRALLKSYGMLAVQLEGQSGEQLQIATGKTAKLRFVIPSSLTSAAPSTIPLWSLDEADGLWKEEGQATKTAGYYEGDVAHFSFWNCDAASNTIYLELTVVTSDGPLPGTLVKLTKISNGASSYGYTDSTGHVGGLVFSNEPLLLEILNNCYESVHTENIGPFTQNTNLGTITVTIPAQSQLNITGNAVDCNAAAVTNGYAMIYSEGLLISTPIVNGNFSATITRCSGNSVPVEVIVVDNATNQQSTTWASTATTGTVNTGTLTACGISTNVYINYTINGADSTLTAPPDSITHYNVQGTLFSNIVGSNNSSNYISFSMYNSNIGLGTDQLLQSFYAASIGQSSTYTFPQPIYVHITEYGSIGQFITGNFSGIMITSGPTATYNISCTFRVRRTF